MILSQIELNQLRGHLSCYGSENIYEGNPHLPHPGA